MGKFLLEWEDISVSVKVKTNNFFTNNVRIKPVLHKVSGTLYNYSFTGIMGPSGAGKTTLLTALSGRLFDKQGTVYINNKEVNFKQMISRSAFLYQHCVFMENLTVLEHLTFMASLKLKNNDKQLNLCRCIELLHDLNLTNCRDSQLKVLSGGERKKIALATELLNDPDIIFCDEPTTGLDSFNALAVVEKLQTLSKLGKLVVITIHQPSVQVLQYFSHIILLSNGSVEYQGDRNNARVYLERFFGKGYAMTTIEQEHAFYVNGIQDNSMYPFLPKNLSVDNSLLQETIMLTHREYLNWKGNLSACFIQFLLFMMTAALVSVIYQDVFEDNIEQNVAGLLYFLTTELLFTHVYAVINTFPGEFHIFLREKDLYSTQSYFISKLAAMVPKTFFQPLFYFGSIAVLVPFIPTASLYIAMLFILFIASFASSLLGLCVSAHFTSMEYMDLFLVPFDTFSLIITGATLSIPRLPPCILWVKYLSPFSFTYESLNTLYWTTFDREHSSLNNTLSVVNGLDILKKQKYPTNELQVLWNAFYLLLLSASLGVFGFVGLIRKRRRQVSN